MFDFPFSEYGSNIRMVFYLRLGCWGRLSVFVFEVAGGDEV
ncbi:hypothetical protein [Halosquirtibacter xylanolyticus]